MRKGAGDYPALFYYTPGMFDSFEVEVLFT